MPETAARQRLDVLEDAGNLAEAARSRARSLGLSAHDAEEVAQQAYVELLQRHQGGRAIDDPKALIMDIASKRARNRMSRRYETPHDPDGLVLGGRTDPTSDVEVRLENQVDVVTAAEAVAQLSPELRAAFKLKREHVSPKRAAALLGCSRSRFYQRASAAEAYVAEALLGKNRAYDEGTRKLLSAYVLELGSLSSEQRKRVKRLLKDPHAAALALDIRRSQDLLAGALPPVALYETIEPGTLERAGAFLGRVRDHVGGLFGGGREGAEVAASHALAAGGTRGAGTAALGGLGGLGAGQLAAVCGGAAATVACVAAIGSGLLPRDDDAEGRERTVAEPVRKENVTPPKIEPVATLPSQLGREAPTPTPPAPRSERRDTTQSGGGESDSEAESAPVEPAATETLEPTAPPVAQEFGVPAAGVPAAPSAPPPSSTQSGGPATASEVEQQFGP